MTRRTLFILLVMLLTPFSAFAQVETVLQGLAVSYDNIQKATTSTVSAVENLTEAFKHLNTSGVHRFLWYTEKNIREALNELNYTKVTLGEFTEGLSEETVGSVESYMQHIFRFLDETIEELTTALDYIGQARDEMKTEEIAGKLKASTPSIEKALLSMESTKSYINSFVIELK